jgi:hypothetical protein
MNTLEIHALRVFLEAAKTDNFTEAGRLLDLTVPVDIVSARNRAATPVQSTFVEFVNQPQCRTLIEMLAEGQMA